MLTFTAKLKSGARMDVYGRLELPFDQRCKSRLRTRLASGAEVALILPPGEILRGGDLLVDSDGRAIEIAAAPEKLLHVECATPTDLARAAYHVGNRHVPVEVGARFLRLAEDPVLEDMLRGLGAEVTHIDAPFEPEGGAYGGQLHHHDGARIHEYHE